MKDSKPHGKGTYSWKNGSEYTGDWVDGRRSGNGEFEWNNGGKYEGQYLNNLQHGKGKHSYPNGRTEEGTWKEGNKHGEFVCIDGNEKFIQIWTDGNKVSEKRQKLN